MAVKHSFHCKAIVKHNGKALNVSQFFESFDEAMVFATGLIDGQLDIVYAQIIISYGKPK